MYANSRVPNTAVATDDGLLEKVVRKHLDRPWRQPCPQHTIEAFAAADAWICKCGEHRGLILDSGCGTGRSSVMLAQRHPDHLVLGLDKSTARLQRAGRRFSLPANLLLLRADCGAFWKIAAEAGWRLSAHYLLYPNPWPKSGQLKRRWHGHPAFLSLLSLGGELELRSNWRPYLLEFARALEVAGSPRPALKQLHPTECLTDFEQKYRDSGQLLYGLQASLVLNKRTF